MSRFRVHKFGGSSVADAACMTRVAPILEADPAPCLAVVSPPAAASPMRCSALVAAAAAGVRSLGLDAALPLPPLVFAYPLLAVLTARDFIAGLLSATLPISGDLRGA